ncbi:SGNH/GDSL hydrolase family protein [Planktothrix agardhii]|uniref:SGNH/GDSL hydrolase family protein n=1 Tax=Planktothrix agardhii TaxID=1160 RepID=UPI0003FBD412|nr:SGNH/GDSL hydrolase family protein [Planktothrix agardhii]
MKIWKSLILNTSLVFASLVLAIVLGEVGLRIAGIEHQPPLPADSESLAYSVNDPERGWSPRPNAKTVWAGEGEVSEVKMNSFGMRDRERTLEKPANSYRIAVIGDSFMEALHVPLEKTALSIMETQLKTCPILKGKNIEVLNFGVQGYGTAQELMTWRHHAQQFSPDLVILGFYPGNDIRNNFRPLEHDHLRPYFVEKNGQLVEDVSFRKLNPNSIERDYYLFSKMDQLPYPLMTNSRILQVMRQAEMESKRRQLQKDYQETEINFYKEPPDQNWQQAWKITEQLITLLRDEVKAKGKDFMLIMVSDSFQVMPDPKKRQEFMEKHQIKDLFYPNKRIEALGKQKGFPVLQLAKPLRKEAERAGICLHGFKNAEVCGGHWNVEGNRVAGELMASQVCQQLMSQTKKTQP